MHQLLSLFLSATLLGGCSGSRGSSASPSARPSVELASAPWEALARGNFEEARVGFQRWQRDAARADEARAGLLSLEQATSDEAAARALLAPIDPGTCSPLLAVTAGEVALGLRPLPAGAAAFAARACALRGSGHLGLRAATVCSWRPLIEAGRALDRCTAGCDRPTTLPLHFAGSQPVVMASVNGGEPAAFIVDTGASTSVVTRAFAAKAGLAPLAGSEFAARSTGGTVPSARALASIRTGGLTVEDVPLAIIDLPFDAIAGIIAPQDVWRQVAVDFDFRRFTVTLASEPRLERDPSLVALPYLQHDYRPMMLFRGEGRPARPIVLDTGAQGTVLHTSWEKLGAPLRRLGAVRMAGAGGQGTRNWVTRTQLRASAGELAWTMDSPMLTEDALHSRGPVTSVGLLGMDLMMGRRVVVDVPRRKLWFSKDAILSDWPVGATTTYQVTIPGHPRPIAVRERVVERGSGSVVLEVAYKHPEGARSFRYQMADTWKARGTWLIARPALRLWDLSGGAPTEVDARRAAEYWMPIFVPFQTVAGTTNPKLTFELLERAGVKLSCTTVRLPARAGKTAVELMLTECPADPWRIRRITLRRQADQGVLWDVQR